MDSGWAPTPSSLALAPSCPPGLRQTCNFVNQTSPPLSLQVEILPQGRESPIFKQFFKDWK